MLNKSRRSRRDFSFAPILSKGEYSMPAYRYKVKTGTMWRVQVNFTEDGVHKQHCKRGFKTKRETQEYERTLLLNPKQPQKPHRGFQSDTQGETEQRTSPGRQTGTQGLPEGHQVKEHSRTFAKNICSTPRKKNSGRTQWKQKSI